MENMSGVVMQMTQLETQLLELTEHLLLKQEPMSHFVELSVKQEQHTPCKMIYQIQQEHAS